ncbi:alpha/beta hydrolase [Chryseobacterium sp. ISL-6]|uniref:alpha/beta hydrolase n=1 Tax=Chryseobacterium sp. ISL-6 TaxID=2819143 RepID=UPI001BE8A9D7|nr:alpha/beta hydrolase [Chryseobacterium sp. ISL-6]MBT2623685.1 alpha/beta hydrolase [Chryseobacterium sp. ISL-6]
MKILTWDFTTIIVIAPGIFISFQVSSWPDTLLIRHAFNKNCRRVSEAMEPFLPSGINRLYDLRYMDNDKDALLDVHFPDSISTTDDVLPTIAWIHGGSWISGSKENVANYCKMLAGKGFTVVAINYSVASEYTYPTLVIQANAALDYLNRNGTALRSISIARDFGGAQVAAQLANIISQPSYTSMPNIKSLLKREQLRAILLFCGAYDINDIKEVDLNGLYKRFLKTALWAYSGMKNFTTDPAFPPAFISVGNADPLASQSYAFARKLTRLNIKVDTLFFTTNYTPLLPYEYQFDFSYPARKMALEEAIAFLSSTLKK